MNDEKFDNFNHSFNELKKQLKELRRKRKQFNHRIKRYIRNFQIIESNIYKSLFDAREFYKKRRNLINKKTRKLKKRKPEYKNILDNLIKEKKDIQKPEIISNTSEVIDDIKKSINQIEDKIGKLNKIITTQVLDINEENDIVNKIRELEKKKENQIGLLSKIEQKQITELHTSNYYKILKKIEILESELLKIENNLTKLGNKRRITHKKMLDLYRKAREFENFKKKMEKELIENKEAADQYYPQFLELFGQNEKIIRDRINYKLKNQKQIHTPMLDYVIEQKKSYKKLMKERLAIALEKQKAGKRIDISEFRLILKKSKKKI